MTNTLFLLLLLLLFIVVERTSTRRARRLSLFFSFFPFYDTSVGAVRQSYFQLGGSLRDRL